MKNTLIDVERQQKLTSETFFNLYQGVSSDEDVVKISDAPGLTIIRKYNETTKYFKDGNRIFVKFYVHDGHVIGSVNLVHKNEDGTFTSFDSAKPYENPFTNFFFDKGEGIIFDSIENKFLFKGEKFGVNDFVELLVKNHLSTNLRLWLTIKRKSKIYFLKLLFWIMDWKYDWLKYYELLREQGVIVDKTGNIDQSLTVPKAKDPFFEYFHIYKNMLFLSLSIITIVTYYFFSIINFNEHNFPKGFQSLFKRENFSVTNPIWLFSFFIILFLLERCSSFLHGKATDQKGFIYKVHESSLNDSFSLKIYGSP